MRTDIDDYNIARYYFNKKPTENTVRTIEKLIELDYLFFIGQCKPVYICWECGRETHWLDIEGDLDEKISALKERYCGC